MEQNEKREYRMRPRFSIRTLLILTAMVAAACYWWIARPTILANRFARALNAGNRQEFEAMLVSKRESIASEIIGTMFDLSKPTMGPVSYDYKLQMLPLDWNDLFHRERRMKLQITYRPGSADGQPPAEPFHSTTIALISTPAGVRRQREGESIYYTMDVF